MARIQLLPRFQPSCNPQVLMGFSFHFPLSFPLRDWPLAFEEPKCLKSTTYSDTLPRRASLLYWTLAVRHFFLTGFSPGLSPWYYPSLKRHSVSRVGPLCYPLKHSDKNISFIVIHVKCQILVPPITFNVFELQFLTVSYASTI